MPVKQDGTCHTGSCSVPWNIPLAFEHSDAWLQQMHQPKALCGGGLSTSTVQLDLRGTLHPEAGYVTCICNAIKAV